MAKNGRKKKLRTEKYSVDRMLDLFPLRVSVSWAMATTCPFHKEFSQVSDGKMVFYQKPKPQNSNAQGQNCSLSYRKKILTSLTLSSP